MGRDNQDYFKRGGRSEGPPGPLGQFRARLAQQQAELARGGERGFPGAGRPFPLAPPPARAEEEHREANPEGQTERAAHREDTAEARPPPRERAGEEASGASFGPPASEEFAEGLRSGVQTYPHESRREEGSLPRSLEQLVRRFPRLSRTFARMSRLPEKPARRIAEMGRRIERVFESGGH